MALYWDPLVSRGEVPSQWEYVYNFEVWHERSLQQLLKSTTEEDSPNFLGTTNSSSSLIAPTPPRPSQLQSLLQIDPRPVAAAGETEESSPEYKLRSRSFDFIQKLTKRRNSGKDSSDGGGGGGRGGNSNGNEKREGGPSRHRMFRKSETSARPSISSMNYSNLPVDDYSGNEKGSRQSLGALQQSQRSSSSRESDGGNDPVSAAPSAASTSTKATKMKTWLGKFKP